jgi:hypothetical protein
MGFGIKLIDGVSQANDQEFKLLAGKDVDLTEADDFGGDLADEDLILVDEAAAGTQASTKKSTVSRVWTYTQAKIAGTENIIDSDQYVDASINTEHIADDQVTLAKMAGIDAGHIIYGDASNNPASLAQGSDGHVLTLASGLPSWAASSADTYTFTQSSVSNTWVINHNLGKFPSVTVVDSGESVVVGTIVFNTLNQITITFFAGGSALAFSGKAYLN